MCPRSPIKWRLDTFKRIRIFIHSIRCFISLSAIVPKALRHKKLDLAPYPPPYMHMCACMTGGKTRIDLVSEAVVYSGSCQEAFVKIIWLLTDWPFSFRYGGIIGLAAKLCPPATNLFTSVDSKIVRFPVIAFLFLSPSLAIYFRRVTFSKCARTHTHTHTP